MYCIIICGAPGQGKSPFIRDYIKDKKCFVYDVQNEYGQATKYPGQVPVNLSANPSDERARYTLWNHEGFISECAKKQNTICVFEDATMFFEGRTIPKMRELLARRRFTGNNYLLVFHSIESVPPRMMQFSDYVVLFKTGDELKGVERKYSKLVTAFTTLQGQKEGYITVKTL